MVRDCGDEQNKLLFRSEKLAVAVYSSPYRARYLLFLYRSETLFAAICDLVAISGSSLRDWYSYQGLNARIGGRELYLCEALLIQVICSYVAGNQSFVYELALLQIVFVSVPSSSHTKWRLHSDLSSHHWGTPGVSYTSFSSTCFFYPQI